MNLPYYNYEKFDLSLLNDDECESEFRFLGGDIDRLTEVFRLPPEFICYNGVTFDADEALCIFLKRFAYPYRYQDLIHRFGRPVPQLCMISNLIMNTLYDNWRHLLSTMQQNWLTQRNLEQFAHVVHDRGAP